jgi:hypothetical protein
MVGVISFDLFQIRKIEPDQKGKKNQVLPVEHNLVMIIIQTKTTAAKKVIKVGFSLALFSFSSSINLKGERTRTPVKNRISLIRCRHTFIFSKTKNTKRFHVKLSIQTNFYTRHIFFLSSIIKKKRDLGCFGMYGIEFCVTNDLRHFPIGGLYKTPNLFE